MPYLYSAEQQQIATEAQRLLSDTFDPAALKGLLERQGAYDERYWQACCEMGWTGVTIPEAYGGLGLGAIELSLIAEASGRFVCGAPFLGTSFGVSEALLLWGSEQQKQAWLPGLASGALKGAVFLSTAQPGRARMVSGGCAADLLLTLHADQLVVIDLRQGRIQREPVQSYDNSRLYADIAFAGADVQRLAVSDIPGAAWQIRARLAVIAAFEQIGGSVRCMELARDYANERKAFGQPIGKFQAIKHRIAEIYVANEITRGNALRAALALSRNDPDLVLRAGAARLSAIHAFDFAAREAIHVHGAMGVTFEHDLHLYFRRAKALSLEFGSAPIWEDAVTDALNGESDEH